MHHGIAVDSIITVRPVGYVRRQELPDRLSEFDDHLKPEFIETRVTNYGFFINIYDFVNITIKLFDH